MFSLVFWVFVLFLGFSYFGISIQEIINSPAGQANFAYLHSLLLQAWHWLAPYIQTIQSSSTQV